jgi:hypothetical protein
MLASLMKKKLKEMERSRRPVSESDLKLVGELKV